MSTSLSNLTASALTKKYGNLTAVDCLDLELRPGEVYGFLGPNGSGKSTTIGMLTGVLAPTSGDVAVCGFDLKREPEKAKAFIGYVPDEPVLYEKLTGLEFLDFVGDLYGVPKAVRKARALELLGMLGLEYKGPDLIQSYSKGMRQKISIAAALLHNPRVLIMDEPVSGLDPMSARVLKSLVRNLARSGTAVLISTHLLEIAERMCDRIGILVAGRLIAEGTMDELRDRTRDSCEGTTLEDVFISLAAGEEYKEIIASLDREADAGEPE
ncbi:MAG: ABC transporter ATP-binding protein [Bacillota bacterium]